MLHLVHFKRFNCTNEPESTISSKKQHLYNNSVQQGVVVATTKESEDHRHHQVEKLSFLTFKLDFHCTSILI